MGHGYAPLDTSAHESLLVAAEVVEIIEKRQGSKVPGIDELAFQLRYVFNQQLWRPAQSSIKKQCG
jgi:glucose-1-phosphate thymidylyltransferase